MVLLVALVFVVTAGFVGVVLLATLGRDGQGRTTVPTDPGADLLAVPALEIACGADGASVRGDAVDATPDGVPVQVVGDDGAVLSFASPGIPGYRMRVFEPSGAYALPLAPGPWAVECAVSGSTADAAVLGVFAVRDPDQVYLRTRPECPADGCCDDTVDLPAGFTRDDVGTLHEGLADVGVRASDTIERAAFPASSLSTRPPNPLVYRVVRDLQIVARVEVAGERGAWSARVYGCPAA